MLDVRFEAAAPAGDGLRSERFAGSLPWRRRHDRGRHGRGWRLVVDATEVSNEEDAERRFRARLHVPPLSLPVPVELVLCRWSARRTELRIELRGRHLRVPHRYFEAAHAAADRLRGIVTTVAA